MHNCRRLMRGSGLRTLSCRLASAHVLHAGILQFACPDGGQCCAQSSPACATLHCGKATAVSQGQGLGMLRVRVAEQC
jgi:hypothetical protein